MFRANIRDYEERVDENNEKRIIWKPDGKTLNVKFDITENLKLFSGKEKSKINNKVGLFACGSAVVASQSKVQDDVKAHSRKVRIS